MAKKHADLLKAKQKRQKIIAAVGGLVLLALLGIQVPRVMKQLHKPPPPTLPPPTTTVAASSASVPSTPSSAPVLASADVKAADGQLASFSRFSSKDPFAQQLGDRGRGNSPSANGSGAADRSAPAGGGGSGSTSGSGTNTASGSSKRRATTEAVISVNGTLTAVATGGEFPQPTAADPNAVPLFRLVSQAATTASIAIVGGSYSSGATTVTLRVNKPVTLMNTADGTRYKLVLKPRGTRVPTQD